MKSRFTKLLGVSALLVFVIPAHASQADKFLTRLQGDWKGEGKAFGGVANVQLKWEWVLEGKFLRLSLRQEISAFNRAKQIFEGQAYYRPTGEDKYAAHWFDSRGVTFTISAHVEGDTMTALWGSPDKEEGKSTYQLINDTTMQVVDSVKQKDGTFRQFSSVTLKRT